MDDLWQETLNLLRRGDFTALEQMLAGPENFDRWIIEWQISGRFRKKPDLLAEAFACACMLGRTKTARFLIEAGVDPYAGMKTGLAGPHYAASSGHVETLRMLISYEIPLEVRNRYGVTVLGQALYSAVNEFRPTHSAIIEDLLNAGAEIESETLDWWNGQDVPSAETKRLVANSLRHHVAYLKAAASQDTAAVEAFRTRLLSARTAVSLARFGHDRHLIADALKSLGNIERRLPDLRELSNETFDEACEIYRELDLPLDVAWIKRHIGLNHEYAGDLETAELYYDESLDLNRSYEAGQTLDHANAVRYVAVIKQRLGKYEESTRLWTEAYDRYGHLGAIDGVAEAAAWIAMLNHREGKSVVAREWIEKARIAASRSNDSETQKFVTDVKSQLV